MTSKPGRSCSAITVFYSGQVLRLPLTKRERDLLAACYSDGLGEQEIADRLGTSRESVARSLRWACDKLERAGYPRPRPYGRGTQAELRRVCPWIDRRLD